MATKKAPVKKTAVKKMPDQKPLPTVGKVPSPLPGAVNTGADNGDGKGGVDIVRKTNG